MTAHFCLQILPVRVVNILSGCGINLETQLPTMQHYFMTRNLHQNLIVPMLLYLWNKNLHIPHGQPGVIDAKLLSEL